MDDDPDLPARRANPIWEQANVELCSVGIDIGSSSTQVIISSLLLRREGAGLATRFVVVERSCRYQSDVAFTPFSADRSIDGAALGALIDGAYAAAHVTPADIDTGVVLLTGEALRRRNAERIAAIISERAGDFVCAAAGHHMEAVLAAHGSGAVRLSADGRRILNVDIGGGSTKLSLVTGGRVLSTAALHAGGRLLVTDRHARIIRLEPIAQRYADEAGVSVALGCPITAAQLDAIAEAIVDVVVSAVAPLPGRSAEHLPYLTAPLPCLDGVDAIVCSGGVAEYIYERESRDFDDLGRRIGVGLRRRLDDRALPYPLEPADARIRATALGASQFSLQLSGSTCYLSDASSLLPRRNLPVVRPPYPMDDEVDVDAIASAVRARLDLLGDGAPTDVMVALRWEGPLVYRRIRAFAEAVREGLACRVAEHWPIFLAVDADIGRNLGAVLRDELGVGVKVLVVDGVDLDEFDFVDLGTPISPSLAIPVTIKSLVFTAFD